jgi:hypothetical protein
MNVLIPINAHMQYRLQANPTGSLVGRAIDPVNDHAHGRIWTPGCGSPFADEHIARENQHNLEAIIRTFGQTGRYDVEPWDDIA